MKIVHLNAGNEFGGGLVHIVSLLKELDKYAADLIVFEEGPVAQAARKAGITVYVFEQKNRLDITVLYRLRQFIKNQDYTILHTHGPRANALIALLYPFMNANWIMTVHSHPLLDFKDRGLKGKAFESIHRQTFKKADGIIAVSNEIKGILETFGVSSDRVEVIHNGIAYKESDVSDDKKPSHVFTLITIGRLTKVKGYDILMDTLKSVAFNNWQWMICGDGDEMKSLKERGESYGLTNQLSFRGWLSSSEISQALHEADIFILPSLSEGFPMNLLEAAREHVPAIASDVGDVKEVIKDDTMGWLIPSGSQEALEHALNQAYVLWQSDQLREKGENLHSFASRFSLEEQTEKVVEFYQNTIDKNRK